MQKRTPKTRNCTSVPSVPGTIQVDKSDDKTVIHLFGQWLPGKPGKPYNYPTTYSDTYSDRILFFKNCLKELDNLELDTVAMPYQIGCGLAGGNWDIYRKLLEDCKTKIILYKLSS